MPPVIKYRIPDKAAGEFFATLDANPDVSNETLFKTFPELNNDEGFLNAMGELHATIRSGQKGNALDAFPELRIVPDKMAMPVKPVLSDRAAMVKPPPSAQTIAEGVEQTRVEQEKLATIKKEEKDFALAMQPWADEQIKKLEGVYYDMPKREEYEGRNERGLPIKVQQRSRDAIAVRTAIDILEEVRDAKIDDVGGFFSGLMSRGIVEALPFVGTLAELPELRTIMEAAKAEAPTEGQKALITAESARRTMEQLKEKPDSYRWGQLLADMAPYMAEYVLTSGVGGAASTAVRGALVGTAKNVGKSAIRNLAADIIETGLSKSIIQAAVNPGSIAKGAVERQTPEIGALTKNEKGEFVPTVVTDAERKNVESVMKSVLKTGVTNVMENFTEKWGGYTDEVFAALKKGGVKVSKEEVAGFLQAKGEKWLKRSQNIFRKAGYDGFVNEVLIEEVPGQFITPAITGDPIRGVQMVQGLMDMTVVSGLLGVGASIGDFRARKKEFKIGQVGGEFKPEQASHGVDGDGNTITSYNSGLTYEDGKAVIIQKIITPDGVNIFRTPDSRFTGDSVEAVAKSVLAAGTPKVTAQQQAQAEVVVRESGATEEGFYTAFKDIFNYTEDQARTAAKIADRVIKTIATRQGITPDEAFDQISFKKAVGLGELGEVIEAPATPAEEKLKDKLKLFTESLPANEVNPAPGVAGEEQMQGAYVPKGGVNGIIFAFKDADVTTALHELAHHFEQFLTPEEIGHIEKWSGAKKGQTQFSEEFSRGFERFLKDGKVTSEEMKSAFEKFRTYLTKAIKKWINTGNKLSPQMQTVYRAMIGEEEPEKKSKKYVEGEGLPNGSGQKEGNSGSSGGNGKALGEKTGEKGNRASQESQQAGQQNKKPTTGNAPGASKNPLSGKGENVGAGNAKEVSGSQTGKSKGGVVEESSKLPEVQNKKGEAQGNGVVQGVLRKGKEEGQKKKVETKPQKNAIQVGGSAALPLVETSRGGEKMGKGVPGTKKSSNAHKEEGKEKVIDTGNMPAVQRSKVKNLTASGGTVVKKYNLKSGDTIYPIVEMSVGGKPVFINTKGDSFASKEDALSKSVASGRTAVKEKKKAEKKPEVKKEEPKAEKKPEVKKEVVKEPSDRKVWAQYKTPELRELLKSMRAQKASPKLIASLEEEINERTGRKAQKAVDRSKEERGVKPTEKKEEVKEEPRKKRVPTAPIVRAMAQDAGIDYDTNEFRNASEKLTGQAHLDEMTDEQLVKMVAFIDHVVASKKEAPKEVIVAEEKAVAPAEMTNTEKSENVNALVDELNKKSTKIQWSIGLEKLPDTKVYGRRMDNGEVVAAIPVSEILEGNPNIYTKEAEAQAQRSPNTGKNSALGNASSDQPGMKPSHDPDSPKATQTAQVAQIKAENKKNPPKDPVVQTRTPKDQPTEDTESTVDLVVEALRAEPITPFTTMNELIDYVSSLDVEGQPMNRGVATAIAQQMVDKGYVKVTGKRVTPLYQKKPVKKAVDYTTESRKQVAGDVARRVSQYDAKTNMGISFTEAVLEWYSKLGEGIKNDYKASLEAIKKSYNLREEDAKKLLDALKKMNPTLPKIPQGLVAQALDAFASGRAEYFDRMSKGLGLQIKDLQSLTSKDFMRLGTYQRFFSMTLGAALSVVQAGKVLMIGNFEEKFWTPKAIEVANWVADKAKKGVIHQNILIRGATKTMQGFYRGLTYTSAQVGAQGKLKGAHNEATLLSMQWMDEMYNIIEHDPEKLARVHALLDPEAYAGTDYSEVKSFNDLTPDEQIVYQMLKDNMVLLHDHSYARGFIDKVTYDRVKAAGGYFGRMYNEIVADQYGPEVEEAFKSVRAEFSIYKHRKDFKEATGNHLTLLQDPVFIAAQRMAVAIRNQAIYDYANDIADVANSKIITYKSEDFDEMNKKRAAEGKGPIKGFTQLGNPLDLASGKGIYGDLTGKYVPNYVAYDFRGFFLTSQMSQSFYNSIKKYDRWAIRQEMKKVFTVYNPAVFLGNQASNYTMAMLNNVDLFHFNLGIKKAGESIKNKDEMYHKLVEAGLLGTDIYSHEFAPLVLQTKPGAPSAVKATEEFLNRVRDAYSKTDDKAKISAYWVKTEIEGKTHDQAITEVFQGFQNYASVGMFFDISAKLPVFGNPFVKFKGDMLRIVGTAISYRPLTTMAYLGTIVAMQQIASGLSGEDDEERKLRERRGYKQKIPFTDIPLTFKIGKKEIDITRFIAPWNMFDKGSNGNFIDSFTEMLPVVPYVRSNNSNPGYWKFDDPLIGTPISLFNNQDFRGMAITNPIGNEPSSKRTLNGLMYLTRTWGGWIPATGMDLYLIHTQGTDYFNRKRSMWERWASNVIRVEEYGSPEIRAGLEKEIKTIMYEIQKVGPDRLNELSYKTRREIERINAMNISDEQKNYRVFQQTQNFEKSAMEINNDVNEVAKKLTDPRHYLDVIDAIELKKEKKP